MVSKQLLDYIKREDSLGKSKKEVENILVSAGWHKDAISDAFYEYYKKGKKTGKVEEAENKTEQKTEEAKEGVKHDKAPEPKVKKRVRPIFLIILSFVLGAAIMLAVTMFILNKPVKKTNTKAQTMTGFQEQKMDDGERIAIVMDIQEQLESYYNEYKIYPEKINSLSSTPTVSNELNYVYTPIGSPAQSYTLNIEMKNTGDGEFKIDGGFMTLKNKQGTK